MAKAKAKLEPDGITDLEGNPGSPNADLKETQSSKPKKEASTVGDGEVAKKSDEKPAAPKPVVPFRVFAAVSGIKTAAMAGFRSHVMRERPAPTTIEGWRRRYQEFMDRPVKSLKR